MNVTETIQTFLTFFTDRGHQVIQGSSLVRPAGDPVMFTSAGMHPLTPYLEGMPHPQGRRLAGAGAASWPSRASASIPAACTPPCSAATSRWTRTSPPSRPGPN